MLCGKQRTPVRTEGIVPLSTHLPSGIVKTAGREIATARRTVVSFTFRSAATAR
jgi:hypothetical protein